MSDHIEKIHDYMDSHKNVLNNLTSAIENMQEPQFDTQRMCSRCICLKEPNQNENKA